MAHKIQQLYAPSLWIGFSCLDAAKPLRGDSLLLTILISSTSEG